MANAQRLTPEQRQFFGLVEEAAFANPFGPERRRLNLEIAGAPQDTAADPLLAQTAEAVAQRLDGIDPRRYAGKEREQLVLAALFLLYHRHMDDFDGLIGRQEQAGDQPVAVRFAPALLEALAGLGLEEGDSARWLGLFYQLRRAFHFIEREIAGDCPSVVELRMHLWNAVFTFRPDWYLRYLCGRMEDFATLLVGETGTGKSAAARALGLSGFIPFDGKTGRYTESYTRAFLAINLAQYPAGLVESELFGHRKGAFTGAVDAHEGLLARCSPHGSVFMDEIGDVEPALQLKLLTVLQERAFNPIGSHEKKRFHGRVIAATNRDLAALRREGRFRDDFYYRLCSDVIVVPPLRERLQEDPDELRRILVNLVRRILGGDGQAETFAAVIRQRIDASLPPAYPWPGNVRELEQCVRRICLTGRYAGDQPPQEPPDDFLAALLSGELSAEALLGHYCRRLYARHGSYEAVAKIARLDRRTVKKYVAGA